MSLRSIVSRVLAFELIIVAGVVALSVLSTRLLPLAAGVCGFIFVLKIVARKSLRLPGAAFILLMGIMMVVSLIITPLPEITWVPVLRLFTGIALFYALADAVAGRAPAQTVVRWQLPPSLPALLAAFTLAGAIIALTAPISVNWAAAKVPFLSELYTGFAVLLSDSVHPNVMAGTLILILPVPVALLLFRQARGLPIWMWWACVVLMSTVLLLTLSRGGYMGMGAAAIALIIVRWRKAGLILLAVLALLVVMLLLLPELQERALALVINDGVSASVAGRLEIWSRGWYMVQDFPFTGIGMGMHEKMIEVMYPYFINPIPLAHAHNLFLQVAVDLGIPGLIAWLGILANVIFACVTLLRSREPLLRAAGAGLLASNVALCVHGLTDAVTWGIVRTAPLVWALWGLAIGASLLCKPRPPAGETAPLESP